MNDRTGKYRVRRAAVLACILTAVVLMAGACGKKDNTENTKTESHVVVEENNENAAANTPEGEQNAQTAESIREDQPSVDESEAENISQENVSGGHAQIVQRAEADYEEWLAAGMIIAVSMKYPDFELNGVYLASSTELEHKSDSQGAYVLFSSEGENYAVYSRPLDKERSEAGTIDLHSQNLDFATFDLVAAETVDKNTMKEISPEELNELIAQSILVSIYEH